MIDLLSNQSGVLTEAIYPEAINMVIYSIKNFCAWNIQAINSSFLYSSQ